MDNFLYLVHYNVFDIDAPSMTQLCYCVEENELESAIEKVKQRLQKQWTFVDFIWKDIGVHDCIDNFYFRKIRTEATRKPYAGIDIIVYKIKVGL